MFSTCQRKEKRWKTWGNYNQQVPKLSKQSFDFGLQVLGVSHTVNHHVMNKSSVHTLELVTGRKYNSDHFPLSHIPFKKYTQWKKRIFVISNGNLDWADVIMCSLTSDVSTIACGWLKNHEESQLKPSSNIFPRPRHTKEVLGAYLKNWLPLKVPKNHIIFERLHYTKPGIQYV